MSYCVLIVDDEERTRLGLTNYIAWETLGFTRPLSAADLSAARKILQTEHIDLLISDICLPDGTGLELCEIAHAMCPDMPILLLSAYGEFEYAQEAIRLGVKHYFTKPTDLQALSSVLLEEKNLLEQRLENSRKQDRSRQFLVSRIWKDLANGIIQDENYLQTFLTDCGIHFPHKHYVLLKFESSCTIPEHVYVDLIDYLKEANLPAYSFVNADCKYTLVNTPDALILCDVLSLFIRNVHPGLCIHISPSTDQLSRLSKCMVQLLRNPQIISGSEESELPDTTASQEDLLILIEDALIESIKSNNRTNAALLLDELYQAYTALPMSERSDVFTRVLLLIQQYTRRFGITLSAMYGKDFSLSHTALQLTTPRQMDLWLREHIAAIYKRLQNIQNDYSQQAISQIHSYIENHFSEDITLATVSQHVHLSSYYISKLFKKATGQNFVDYLTSVRMEKAMSLLSSPETRVYEVAEQVGYKSTKHFSQVFRSYTGKTPSEYRQIYCKNNKENL